MIIASRGTKSFSGCSAVAAQVLFVVAPSELITAEFLQDFSASFPTNGFDHHLSLQIYSSVPRQEFLENRE